MAMTLAMDREPEVARFIDTYKFDQDMATKRDRFGGGTSLPLNSDGYEDKQRALRDERHKDWLVQQDKPRILRNALYEEQRHAEQQKQEARRYAPQARPAQPLGPQMDYNAAGELAKAEEKKAYQDYMKAKEERYWALRGRPVTPPGGLNIGQYDRQVKEQAPQKKQEYKRMLDEQQKEHMFLRARQEPEMAVIDRNAQSSQFLANKPPPGPSYGRGRDEDEKRKHESEVFQQQHGGKPAEIVKNPFYSSDDYEKFQKELKKKQEKEYSEFLSKRFMPPKNSIGLPIGQYKYEPRRLLLEVERNNEWNEIAKEQNSPRVPKQVDGPQGLNIDVSYHREKQEWLEKQRNKDYNEYLKKHTFRTKVATPPSLQGLPIGQQHYDPMYRAMEHQRNREYNDFLQKKYGGNKTFRSSRSQPEKPTQPKSSFYYGNELEHEEKRKMLDDERRNDYHQFMKEQEPPRSKSIDIPTDADSGLPIGQHHHEAWRKFLREQRNSEYNQLKETQKVAHPGRRHEFVDSANGPYGGLFHGLGEHGNRSDDLNRERHREYNEKLEQQYAGRDRPGGRPKWVQESLPNNTDRGRSPMKTQPPTDQYQQMLNEKRREEANMRRYEDPEYQDRLAHGRDRGEAGQRYGY